MVTAAGRQLVNQLEIGGDEDVKTRVVYRNWRDVKFHADLAERPHYVVGAKRVVLPNAKKCVHESKEALRADEMRGSSSLLTFTDLLKSICCSYFITASSRMDRDQRKICGTFTAITFGRVQETFIRPHIKKRKFFCNWCAEKWHDWCVSVKIFFTDFRF